MTASARHSFICLKRVKISLFFYLTNLSHGDNRETPKLAHKIFVHIQSNPSLRTPAQYGHLIITDSFLCPWGKIPLTFSLQSTLSKTDTFGTGTKCPSWRDVRLIESQIKGVKKGRDQLRFIEVSVL